MVRSIASSESAPVAESPSPKRTMRENASTTRKPVPTGRATSSRQLFVPRSRAANWGANRCATGGEDLAPLKSSAAARSDGNAATAPPTDPLLLSGFSTASEPSRLSATGNASAARRQIKTSLDRGWFRILKIGATKSPRHTRVAGRYHIDPRRGPHDGPCGISPVHVTTDAKRRKITKQQEMVARLVDKISRRRSPRNHMPIDMLKGGRTAGPRGVGARVRRATTQRRLVVVSDEHVARRIPVGRGPQSSRMGDRLTVGQRTLTPPV